MITKGILRSIDYTGNTCEVELPVFKTAETQSAFIVTATIISAPGIYGGYLVNDIVYVGFEDNQLGKAVVLGKLSLGTIKDGASTGGTVKCSNLSVATSAELPVNTKISYAQDNSIALQKAVVGSTYNSITDIVEAIKSLSNDFNTYKSQSGGGGTTYTAGTAIDLTNNVISSTANTFSNTETIIGKWIDNKTLYQKVISYTNSTGSAIFKNDLSISDLSAAFAWIDNGNSFIKDNTSNIVSQLSAGNVSGTFITGAAVDLTNKVLIFMAPANSTVYITLRYTK